MMGKFLRIAAIVAFIAVSMFTLAPPQQIAHAECFSIEVEGSGIPNGINNGRLVDLKAGDVIVWSVEFTPDPDYPDGGAGMGIYKDDFKDAPGDVFDSMGPGSGEVTIPADGTYAIGMGGYGGDVSASAYLKDCNTNPPPAKFACTILSADLDVRTEGSNVWDIVELAAGTQVFYNFTFDGEQTPMTGAGLDVYIGDFPPEGEWYPGDIIQTGPGVGSFQIPATGTYAFSLGGYGGIIQGHVYTSGCGIGTFQDGSINDADFGRRVAVYLKANGDYHFYGINKGKGYFAFILTADELADLCVATPPTVHTLIKSDENGNRLYQLANSRYFQVNSAPDADGNEYVFGFEPCD